MSPLTVVVIVGEECVVPLVLTLETPSVGVVVLTPMYEPTQPAIGPVRLGVNV
jgi:hypothetical protein